MKKALVIGSGIAGLASAIRLKKLNYEVEVFESNTYTGGKLHFVKSNGFRWDAGPSLFTMPHLVDELFQMHSIDPRDHFQYVKHHTVCNYFWEDGATFSVPSDEQEFIREAATQFNEEPKKIKNYLERSARKYDLTAPIFLESSLHKSGTYLNGNTIKALFQSSSLDLLSSLNDVNRRTFNNPKLVQLFNRYATYNGSSPYQTPGIMSMIPHLEMHYGTFLPKGGMHEISQSLTRLAQDLGVEFHLSSPVEKITHDGDSVTGVVSKGTQFDGDIVVCNMDVFGAYDRLLTDVNKPTKTLEQERSSSALIFYWGINREFEELDLHNIFFSEDYQKEFECIFKTKNLYHDPTVYINITSKLEKKDAPKGMENWFVMINAPGNTGQDWDALIQEGKEAILSKLSRILDADISSMIVAEDVLDPRLIEKRTSSHQGSLYGAASNSRFAAFLRHPNFSGQLKNLYFCGGSAHPGGGIPLCLLSARIATDMIHS